MQKIISEGLVFGIVLMSAPVVLGAPSAKKFIVKDGEALGKIYLPTVYRKATQFAVNELQLHIKKMTGADLKMSWGAKGKGASGFVFKIRPAKEWKGKETSQAFTIEETGTPSPLVTITGNTSIAVLYGVYQYLGDLGVKWLTPGEIGTNIPRMSNIPIRPGKRQYSPSFVSRVLALSSTAGNHFGGIPAGPEREKAIYEYQLYLIRNRTQFARNIAVKGFDFNISHTGSGHAVKPMTGLTKAKVKAGLMEKEPERFALVTGEDFVQKRRYNDGQICFTNEKNIKTAIKNCIALCKKWDAEELNHTRSSDLNEIFTVPMGLSDCFGICECANCKKVAGKAPNSKDRLVWYFWNRVAKGLNEKMPGRMIAVHSPYMDLTQPPDDVKIESNIMVETPLVYSWEKTPENKDSYPFPKTFLEYVTKTRKAGATLGCYNYLNFPWSPTPIHVLDTAKGFADLGYKYYHLEAMQRTEYTWPIIWSLAQYTWSTKTDPREYLKEFCNDYYGEKYGKDIFWIFEEMNRNALTMERIIFGSPSDTSYMLPDKFIGKCRGILRNAIRYTQGKEAERLRRFSIAMEAQFRLAQTYRAYVKALNTRKKHAIADFKQRAKDLQEFWDRNHLEKINTVDRSPKVAATQFLKTDFTNLKPLARKSLIGKTPNDKVWIKELFVKEKIPKNIPNLFPLPEIWKFRLDVDNKGIEEGWVKTDYDDAKGGWNPLSTWNWVEPQGYKKVDGYFCYRLKFKAPKFPEGKKIFLRMGSLDDSGDIYLNGIKLGSQPDPKAWNKSFVIDVTKNLKRGEENVLAVYGYDAGGGLGIWRPSALYTD